jgi:ribosome-associated toxin RatA of RatAB toxin-antitoxin module
VGVPPFLQETYDSAVFIDHQKYTVETHSIKSQKFDSLKSFWKLSPSSVPTTTTPTALDHETSMTLGENTNPNLPNNMQPHSQHHPQIPQTSTAVESTTHVYFMVEMTVSDPLIVTTLDQLLVKVAKQQVEAFAQRCQTA